LIAEGKHTIKSIAVPFTLNYKLGKKKISLTPGAGITVKF